MEQIIPQSFSKEPNLPNNLISDFCHLELWVNEFLPESENVGTTCISLCLVYGTFFFLYVWQLVIEYQTLYGIKEEITEVNTIYVHKDSPLYQAFILQVEPVVVVELDLGFSDTFRATQT